MVGETQEAAQRFWHGTTSADPLWQAFLLPILEEQGQEHLVADPEGLEALWQAFPASPAWRHKGAKVSQTRWFAWVQAFRGFLPYWHTKLVTLTYLGLALGYLTRGAGASVGLTPSKPPAVGEGGEPAKATTKEGGQARISELRTQCRNTATWPPAS